VSEKEALLPTKRLYCN